jgi:ribosomal protein S27AE
VSEHERVESLCGNCGLVYVEEDDVAIATMYARVCPRCHVMAPLNKEETHD